MPPDYLAAVLDLLLSNPLALLAETLAVLTYLHLAAPACYLVFRMMGGEWDGLAWGARVLVAVHEVRTNLLPHRSQKPPVLDTYPSNLAHTDHA